MANEQNLRPFTSDQSREEAKKNGQKGGIASGQARRRRARLREAAEQLMSLPVASEDNRRTLKAMGFADDELTNDKMALLGLFKAAMKGNVEAFKKFEDLLGESNSPDNDTLDKLDEVLDKIGGNI